MGCKESGPCKIWKRDVASNDVDALYVHSPLAIQVGGVEGRTSTRQNAHSDRELYAVVVLDDASSGYHSDELRGEGSVGSVPLL